MVAGLDSVKYDCQIILTMRKPTDLRQKVLDASLALIEEGGLDRLSMREVARKAGVSHQAPYHYFGGLLQPVILRMLSPQRQIYPFP